MGGSSRYRLEILRRLSLEENADTFTSETRRPCQGLKSGAHAATSTWGALGIPVRDELTAVLFLPGSVLSRPYTDPALSPVLCVVIFSSVFCSCRLFIYYRCFVTFSFVFLFVGSFSSVFPLTFETLRLVVVLAGPYPNNIGARIMARFSPWLLAVNQYSGDSLEWGSWSTEVIVFRTGSSLNPAFAWPIRLLWPLTR